ncbi:hypothetical protein D3C85_1354910 [compost metagenome]|jgi:hypothetical protein
MAGATELMQMHGEASSRTWLRRCTCTLGIHDRVVRRRCGSDRLLGPQPDGLNDSTAAARLCGSRNCHGYKQLALEDDAVNISQSTNQQQD